jgi:hypothetical protein
MAKGGACWGEQHEAFCCSLWYHYAWLCGHFHPGVDTYPSGNVTQLKLEVERLASDGVSSFYFDLHSNTALRYAQFDSSTSLPYKSQGRYHLEGDVVISHGSL